MPDLPKMFQKAIEHHRAARYQEAAAIYDMILHHAPNHADTLHLRGFAAYLLGDHTTAVERISQYQSPDAQPGAQAPGCSQTLSICVMPLRSPDSTSMSAAASKSPVIAEGDLAVVGEDRDADADLPAERYVREGTDHPPTGTYNGTVARARSW